MYNAGQAFNYIISLPELRNICNEWLLLFVLVLFRTCAAEGALAEPVFNDLFRYRGAHTSGRPLSEEHIAHNVKTRRNTASTRSLQWLGFAHRLTHFIQDATAGCIRRSVTCGEYNRALGMRLALEMTLDPKYRKTYFDSNKHTNVEQARDSLARPKMLASLKRLLSEQPATDYPRLTKRRKVRVALPESARWVPILSDKRVIQHKNMSHMCWNSSS